MSARIEGTVDSLLGEFYTHHRLSEVEGMNCLQLNGVISGNCVWANDVADADVKNGIRWLRAHKNLLAA